ncbi:hypothetical protein O181_004729 [Austropuccinia psidii MF-1]|uniref:Uncharacterized protein n=1 Tax=Austropuccinia psidii MF-1 TaxID=1389203 RepID=A0A9Q3BGC0_9BASI|nr:hypothetical protein [Austropuccinia psidii MF-1]
MLLMLYPRHASTTTIADLQSPTLTLPHACAILSAPYHAYTPEVPLNILPLPHSHVILSAAYHDYAPTAPYRYVSLLATPSPHSTILMLPHAHLIPSAAYHAYAPTAPYRYASHPPPHVQTKPSLCFHTPTSFFPLLTMLTLLLLPIDMHPPHPMSALNHPYPSTCLPHSLCPFPCLRSHSALNI